MRTLSGIRASGVPHLGNYLGAIKQHIELQEEAEQALYFVADLHALTTPFDPSSLQQSTLDVVAMYLACGLNPSKAILFIQNQRPEHAELAWILSTLTKLGELERMTQFKEKGRGAERESVGAGLLTYPCLMAADILLYQPTDVPVGNDQSQHVELARTLAERFNNKYGETFTVPKLKLVQSGARIMGLDDPSKKMSKSASSEYNYIALTDDAETVERKIKKAVTDSGSEISYSSDKPALKNLLTIYAGLTDTQPTEIAQRYEGKGYADFKADLAAAITTFLTPIQERYQQQLSDRDQLLDVLHTGAKRAQPLARQTLVAVKEKLGLIL